MKTGTKTTLLATGGCFGSATVAQLLGQIDYRNLALVAGLVLVMVFVVSILLSPKS
ncbi:MAG: hypothetical protein HY288_10955 [Planctomycetia bacterium]|nr:hypothetical protein [Planctomycetia bacterium]